MAPNAASGPGRTSSAEGDHPEAGPEGGAACEREGLAQPLGWA
jgi:hypothetical protein